MSEPKYYLIGVLELRSADGTVTGMTHTPDCIPRNADGLTEKQAEFFNSWLSYSSNKLADWCIDDLKAAFPHTFAPQEPVECDRWERTGERRAPCKGEWFEAKDGGLRREYCGYTKAYENNPENQYWILRKVNHR